MKIGVFDSGIGGKSVSNAIQKALPQDKIVYVQDEKNVPYGTKSPSHLLSLVVPILQNLVDQGVDVIVIACNTVTTTIIADLRKEFQLPIIGIEPMIKPAGLLTKSNVIAVCATPATLASPRYKELLTKYAPHVDVIEPDCSDWAFMIEQNAVDVQCIEEQTRQVCERGADVIVLGCTHYHWIEKEIKAIASQYGASVLQPEEAVIRQLKRVLAPLR